MKTFLKKYKPCCEKTCMVMGCESKEAGACYCICRMIDSIENLENIISGKILYDGAGYIYIPNENDRKKTVNSWNETQKECLKYFIEVEAPKLLEKYKEKLSEFEV